jgi:hypothetical protein
MKKYIIITFTILLFTTGCALKRTDEESYSIKNKHQAQSGTLKPIVYGYVFEHETKFPAISPRIYVGKELKSIVNPESGQYSFSINPGKYRFVGMGMSFFSTTTRKVKVIEGDSVRIDFYLKPNATPLHN